MTRVGYTPGRGGRSVPWVDIRDFAAVGDGVTDDYTPIQAAITQAQAAGGGRLLLEAKTYAVGTDLVVSGSDVVIAGRGTVSGIYQPAPTVGTVLKRVGATAGDVIRFQTVTGAATAISGCGVENLAIVGNNTANKGLVLKSVQWSSFKNLHLRNCIDTCIDMFIESSVLDLIEDTQGNVFERVSINQTTSAAGIGIRLDGTQPLGNTSLNVFNRVSIQHTNGTGVKFLNADSNYFNNLLVVRAGGGTGIGVEFNGSQVAGLGHARSNYLYHVDPGLGGVTARGVGLTQPSIRNAIYGHSRENGAPAPTIEAGASLYCVGDAGVVNAPSLQLLGASSSAATITPVVGTPESQLAAPVASVALRTDGTSRTALLVKGSGTGNTGWLPVHVEILSNVSSSGALTATTTSVNAAGGAVTMTLPTASGIQGRSFTIKKNDTSTNAVTIASTSAQTFDGSATSPTLAYQNQSITVVSDGANWLITNIPARTTPASCFMKDDFAAGSIGSTAIGELGWTVTNGTLTTVTAVAGHPGIFNHSVTTSAQVASLRLGGANDTDLAPADFFDTTFIVRLNSNDTATDFRVGVGSASGTAPPGAGIYVEKAFADTSWFGVTRAASVQTRTAALATVTGSFVKFRIRRIDASTIGFTVDGGTELTSTTNIPTAALAFFTQISNNSGAAKSFDIDYFDCTLTGLGR